MPAILNHFAVAPYAALLAILYVMLSVRIIRIRRRESTAIGLNANAELERSVRAHANFSEYVPLALLLIWFAGATGTAPVWINLLGLMLVIGRVFHAYSLIVHEPRHSKYALRVMGMSLTFLTLLLPACLLLLNWLGFALR